VKLVQQLREMQVPGAFVVPLGPWIEPFLHV
jgi:hypothetical protein